MEEEVVEKFVQLQVWVLVVAFLVAAAESVVELSQEADCHWLN